jgi:hypothetical protein
MHCDEPRMVVTWSLPQGVHVVEPNSEAKVFFSQGVQVTAPGVLLMLPRGHTLQLADPVKNW